jgi:hypothetical protein
MRNARRLLPAVMVLAVTAIAAPAAFAQSNPENHETLEVLKEPPLDHCPAVSKLVHTATGGCLIHVKSNGEIELRKHVFGIESHISAGCEWEFWARLNEDAEGAIIHQKLVPHPSSCIRQPCKEAGEPSPTPWPIHLDEGHVPGVDGETGIPAGEWITFNFCVEPVGGGADESCEMSVPFNEIAGSPHQYELGNAVEISSHGISGFRCELVGHWLSEAVNQTLENVPGGEAETKVEIRHIPFENKAEVP